MKALSALQAVQTALYRLAQSCDEADLRRQFHPDLSPLGWHLGHCVHTERLWLRERLLGEACSDADLYQPERSPKTRRGERLPARDRLLDWARRLQSEHLALLAAPPARARRHPLMRGDYLVWFLAQHHAQHVETMRMVLAQREAGRDWTGARGAPLPPQRPQPPLSLLPGGEYLIGNDDVRAFDNERPPRQVRLRPVRLARRLATNGEYLAFLEHGHHQRRHWSAAGWAWRRTQTSPLPEHWRRNADGDWLELTPDGPRPLAADGPVLGLNHYEAAAFAAWAGGRLPHECEWEAAARLGLLDDIGGAWEWCGNRFHPYPGFRAFPYDGYSLPWFDGRHYVLRGASPHTVPWLRRPALRNYYQADKRHIFAGVRVIFD